MRSSDLVPVLLLPVALLLQTARAGDAPPTAGSARLPSTGTLATPARTGEFTTSFTLTTPLADAHEVAQRLLHRIVFEQQLAAGKVGSGQTIDPTQETWQVYVPEDYTGNTPYGVLVWIPPYPTGALPYGWSRVLSDRHLIYVSADKSGNTQGVMDRRVPLALTGLANILATYNIDRSRVYIGGFSGGGITASRAAAAYAEVFTGGLYASTSDGLGSDEVPVPPLDRYALMKDRNRYVLTNGTEETANAISNVSTIDEYKSLCVLRVDYIRILNRGHADLEPRMFARALQYLDDPPAVDPQDLADCEKKLVARRAEAIERVRQAFAAGDKAAAHDRLIDLHREFGPLAEPEFSHFAGCLNGNVLAADCLAAPQAGGN